MKKLILAAATLVILATAGTAQAEQFYTRLPNGQFVKVETQRYNQPQHHAQHAKRHDYRAPVYHAPQPRYVPQHYSAKRYAPVQYRPVTQYCPPRQHRNHR